MTPTSHPKTPFLGEIALDPHTKHFFAKEYHTGPVEKFFRPDLSGTREHIYAGREALLLTGERVVIAQHFYLSEAKRNALAAPIQAGDIFVGDNFYPTSWNSLVVDGATHTFWLNEVFGGQSRPTERANFPLQPLSHGSLTRCHKDFASGFGLRIGYWGRCRFIDLRDGGGHPARDVMFDVDGQTPLELDGPWHRRCSESSMPQGWFIRCPDSEFHEQVDKIAGDVAGQLHQLLCFYGLSNDQRAHEVMGCDLATVRRALPVLRLALQSEMGVLATQAKVGAQGTLLFRPFLGGHGLSVPSGQRVAVPAGLRQRRAKVLAALNCHVAARPGKSKAGALYWARYMGQEWASQFVCESEVLTSAHEVAMAISDFRDALASLHTHPPDV